MVGIYVIQQFRLMERDGLSSKVWGVWGMAGGWCAGLAVGPTELEQN